MSSRRGELDRFQAMQNATRSVMPRSVFYRWDGGAQLPPLRRHPLSAGATISAVETAPVVGATKQCARN
jgi:hypothetical protein